MKIRRATEDDRLPLFKLAAAMHAETDFSRFHFDPQKALNSLGVWINSPACLILVADSDGEVLGMLAASCKDAWFSPDKFASEDFFYVGEAHRGGRAGYQLMRGFVEWAREVGALHIRAGVATGSSPAAERLYQHFQMHHVGGNYSAHLEEATS